MEQREQNYVDRLRYVLYTDNDFDLKNELNMIGYKYWKYMSYEQLCDLFNQLLHQTNGCPIEKLHQELVLPSQYGYNCLDNVKITTEKYCIKDKRVFLVMLLLDQINRYCMNRFGKPVVKIGVNTFQRSKCLTVDRLQGFDRFRYDVKCSLNGCDRDYYDCVYGQGIDEVESMQNVSNVSNMSNMSKFDLQNMVIPENGKENDDMNSCQNSCDIQEYFSNKCDVNKNQKIEARMAQDWAKNNQENNMDKVCGSDIFEGIEVRPHHPVQQFFEKSPEDQEIDNEFTRKFSGHNDGGEGHIPYKETSLSRMGYVTDPSFKAHDRELLGGEHDDVYPWQGHFKDESYLFDYKDPYRMQKKEEEEEYFINNNPEVMNYNNDDVLHAANHRTTSYANNAAFDFHTMRSSDIESDRPDNYGATFHMQ